MPKSEEQFAFVTLEGGAVTQRLSTLCAGRTALRLPTKSWARIFCANPTIRIWTILFYTVCPFYTLPTVSAAAALFLRAGSTFFPSTSRQQAAISTVFCTKHPLRLSKRAKARLPFYTRRANKIPIPPFPTPLPWKSAMPWGRRGLCKRREFAIAPTKICRIFWRSILPLTFRLSVAQPAKTCACLPRCVKR